MSTSQHPLRGRTIVVTGASRGLGRAMAVAAAEAGANLVVTAREVAALEGVAAEIRAFGRKCQCFAIDTARGSAGIEALALEVWSATGGVDVVINNAGRTLFKPCVATTDEEWTAMIDVNLSGLFYSCRSFGRRLLEQGHGKIVNIASDIGIRGERNWAAYSASKGGVVALSKSLAWEWAPTVTVNIVAPGPFYTDANASMFSQPEVRKSVEAMVPLNRIGEPVPHLGPLAVLLAGPGSDFMTGAVFRVDGGICRS